MSNTQQSAARTGPRQIMQLTRNVGACSFGQTFTPEQAEQLGITKDCNTITVGGQVTDRAIKQPPREAGPTKA